MSVSAQNIPFLEKPVIYYRVKPYLLGRDIDIQVRMVTPNGNYMVAGTLYTDTIVRLGDYWMACIDSTGKILWEKSLQAKGDDRLEHAIPTDDGGYILAGSSTSPKGEDKTSESFGMKDYWVVKLNHSGQIEWQQSAGGNNDDELVSLAIHNVGYTVGGWSRSQNSGNTAMVADSISQKFGMGYHGFWTVELDAKGNLISQKDLGDQVYCSLSQYHYMHDGGYLLTGSIYGEYGCTNEFDWLIRLDVKGNILWVKNYTDLPYHLMRMDKFAEAGNGNFYIGKSISLDEHDRNTEYAVMSFKPNGELEWHKSYGGDLADNLEYLYATSNNGLLLGGISKSDRSGEKTENTPGYKNTDIWVLKLDKEGGIEWQTTLGGYDDEFLTQVIELQNGSCIIAGSSISDSSYAKRENCYGNYDYWIVKRNALGNIEWQKTMGGDQEDRLQYVQPTIDGGFLLAGGSESDKSGNKTEPAIGTSDAWLVKLDASGHEMWQKTYGDSSNFESVRFLTQNNQGEIYVIMNYDLDHDRVIKLAANGMVLKEMRIIHELFLYCLPMYFHANHQIIIGKNEIVVEDFASQDYEPFTFENPQLICHILDECFKNIMIMGD